MPYTGISDDNLPQNVKDLPKHQKEIWVAAFNAFYEDCTQKDAGDCDEYAFAVAWAAVNKEKEKRGMSKLRNLVKRLVVGLTPTKREVKDVEKWDGVASNYESTESYCNACLVNVNLSDDPDEWAQDHCMLPVRMDGEKAYVRQAVHAAAGGHGISQVEKPDDVSQDDWDAALKVAAKEIMRAYDEMGEEAPQSIYDMAGMEMPKEESRRERVKAVGYVFDAVWKMIDDILPSAWITDFYFDGPRLFVVVAAGGKLYRINVMIGDDETVTIGEPIEVKIDFPPTATPTPAESEEPVQMARQMVKPLVVIRQQTDGRYRWISISCSAALNRMGEIDSKALFDSFCEHNERTGEYPIRQFYHAGEIFRTGQADWLGRDENLYLTSGLYDDSDIARAEIAARQKDPDYWGDSIGFVPTDEPIMLNVGDISIPVYEKGINREISTLPEAEACAWMTATPELMEERMLSKRQFQAFVKLFGDDEAAAKAWLEEHAASRNRAIADAGMITRQTPAQPAPSAPSQPPAEIVLDDAAVQVIAARVLADLSAPELPAEVRSGLEVINTALAALQGEVAKITARIVTVETIMNALNDDAPIVAPSRTINVSYRPRAASLPDVQPAAFVAQTTSAEIADAIMQSKKC